MANFNAILPRTPPGWKAHVRPRPSIKHPLRASLLILVPATHRPSINRDRREVLKFPQPKEKWPPSRKLGEKVTRALPRPTRIAGREAIALLVPQRQFGRSLIKLPT